MARRALSLHARQLLAACLGLIAFLGGTGYALDHAFSETALSNLKERLQNHAYSYLSDFEFTRYGQLIDPDKDHAPDARFLQPGSGLYAMVRGMAVQWDSQVPPPACSVSKRASRRALRPACSSA